GVEGKLPAFLAFQHMIGVAIGDSQLERSPELVAKVREMVTAGELATGSTLEKNGAS
ncbi:uncharacterized protein METZ01_LOCUS343676, partial [marine metagenome]